MLRALAFAVLAAGALAACSDAPPPPAPGEKPGWPQPSPPRPSSAPLPFTTNYAPLSGQIEQLPPVPKGENVPYYAVPTAGKTPEPTAPPAAAK